MAGWLTDLLAQQGNPAVVTPVEPGRDVTVRRRAVDVPRLDLYTGGGAVEADHRHVYVGSAALITVQGRLHGTGSGGTGWVNRTISVQRVIAGKRSAFASAKTLTPAAPSCEITASELGGADTICIVPAASGSVDTAGTTAMVTVTLQEDVTPVGIVAGTIDSNRVSVASGGSSTPFGD